MRESLWGGARLLFGLEAEPKDLTFWQMGARAVVIYLAALVIVRLGDKRFLGQNSAFDVILAIMLGSVLSRAINGSAPFLETIAGSAVLVLLHWLLAVAAFRWHWLGSLVKGTPRLLIRDGTVQADAMRASHIGEHDLREGLRLQGNVNDPLQVHQAYLERNGKISVLPKHQQPQQPQQPKILDIRVEEGVQIVRIEQIEQT